MAFRDLREFLDALRRRGELHEVKAPVSPELEITEITERVVKAGGPALFFTNVQGYPGIPVLTGAFASEGRMSLALGVSTLDKAGEKVRELLEMEPPRGILDKVRALARLRPLAAMAPRVVRGGPCKEVRQEHPDVLAFPLLKCWPRDGGRYITLPLVITRDPVTGRRNVGMYRLQAFDGRTLGMHWQAHKDATSHHARAESRASRLEVAVAVGCDPVLTYAASAPLPGVDEFAFAGFLRGEPVELVKADTVELEVPAAAEIVIEGYVEPGERRLEGPFGDHTGYYSLAEPYPVMHVTRITHRRDPIYHTTVVGRPPMEDYWLGKATERIFLPLIRFLLPEVVDIDMPAEGVFHNCVLVSIEKRYPMHARKVMYALWGLGLLSLARLIVVFDADVDVHNHSEAAWRAFNNVDPARDLIIAEGPVDALDHSAPQPLWGSKLGVDATRKWREEGHPREWPPDVVMDPEVKRRVTERWEELGLASLLPPPVLQGRGLEV